MSDHQHTLKGAVTITGVGLHTGEKVNLTLNPAPEGHGLKFQRTDMEGQPVIEADADLVVSTARGTTLGKGDAKVNTTEHVLAALYAMNVDNCLIQLDGAEVPIMDGSALKFVEAIEHAGLQPQDAPRNWYELKEPIWFETEERGTEMLGVPAPGGEFRLTVMVDYNSPVLGTQHASMYNNGEFKAEIAPCRTFVFLRELEQLAKAGLIKGGDLDNAIVLEDREDITKDDLKALAKSIGREYQDVEIRRNGVLNTTDLKFLNEPARTSCWTSLAIWHWWAGRSKGTSWRRGRAISATPRSPRRSRTRSAKRKRTRNCASTSRRNRCSTSTPSPKCCRTATRSCWWTK
jgi:UDP-3-O-[3-hydroxymyristoyl] N-acetylglucosamine deacetylase/3-hydroxyacyl-[acyl-carrier-protein] dehydratase